MVVNTKCLWTILIATLYSLTSNNHCLCKSTFGIPDSEHVSSNGLNAEVTLDDELNKQAVTEKRGWDNNFAVWGKRRWENVQAWGKGGERNEDLAFAQLDPANLQWTNYMPWGDRETAWREDKQPADKRKIEIVAEPLNVDDQTWSKIPQLAATDRLDHIIDTRNWPMISTWGKRSYDNKLGKDDKRGWSSFSSWGKRDDEHTLDDMNKRKWSKFTSWGKRENEPLIDEAEKRKWSKFTSWGKRESEPLLTTNDKRKWSKFTSWGKRSELEDALDTDKRKWSKFASWGKRDDKAERDVMEASPDKRKWSRLAAWGKRADADSDMVDKRKWSKFSSWGKRFRNPNAWLALNNWGKRRWTGLSTWGKRSGDGNKAEVMARKLLHFFDLNGMYSICQSLFRSLE